MTTGNPIYRGCPSNKHAGSCAKLDAFNWLKDLQNSANPSEFVEVRFKNTRKDYYRNVNDLPLEVGELVAVESSPGHDIGMVSLTGDLVIKQMQRHKVTLVNGEMRKIYRKAKPLDIEKWEGAMAREHETMIRSRQLAADLKLDMKIGDVEFQGDGTKAIFYYIAEGRVDFRQLIRVLADNFRIRIEMKQIGARQEAGRIGGIGPCGRELCCSTWMSNFSSVSTTSARYQEISLNPQKLAGQCSKLKCCLNYEIDAYIDEQKDFPSNIVKLETEEGSYSYVKSDVFKRMYWYALDSNVPSGLIGLSVDRVHQIIKMNKRGKKPEKLLNEADLTAVKSTAEIGYASGVTQDDLTRFDKPKQDKRPSKNRRRKPQNTGNQKQTTQQENKQANNNQQASDEKSQSRNSRKRKYNPRNRNRKPQKQKSNQNENE